MVSAAVAPSPVVPLPWSASCNNEADVDFMCASHELPPATGGSFVAVEAFFLHVVPDPLVEAVGMIPLAHVGPCGDVAGQTVRAQVFLLAILAGPRVVRRALRSQVDMRGRAKPPHHGNSAALPHSGGTRS